MSTLASREPNYLATLLYCLDCDTEATMDGNEVEREKAWLQVVYDPRLYSIEAVQHPAGIVFANNNDHKRSSNASSSSSSSSGGYSSKQKEQLWLQLRTRYAGDPTLIKRLQQCASSHDSNSDSNSINCRNETFDSLWQYQLLSKFASL